jgi:hypothetical protein
LNISDYMFIITDHLQIRESQCYISTSVQSVHTAPGLGRLSTAGLWRRYK